MKRFSLILLSLIPAIALATQPAPKPTPAPTSTSNAAPKSKAAAASKAHAASLSKSDSTSSAVGGNGVGIGGQSTATGGTAGASAIGGDSNSEASSGGNLLSADQYQVRQVPPVFLSSLMVSDCGAGANAGGSDGSGSGAGGIVWTTKRCYALRSAINFFAIGEYATGCKLLAYVNREALAAIHEKIDCAAIAARLELESRAQKSTVTVVPAAPAPSNCATRDELDRAFRCKQSK